MLRIIVVALILSCSLVACKQSREETTSVAESVNEYPDIVLRFADGSQTRAGELKGGNVFVLFQPDCSHCQEEAVHIEQRLDAFGDYSLYFISSAPMQEIMAFAKNFHLDQKENVKFAWTSTEGVLTYYGPIQTPSIYVYSNGRLKASFNGQTDIENILESL